MLRRICDFCKKEEPDYTIKCRRTNHRIMFNHDWESVDICGECYCKLFSKEINIFSQNFKNIIPKNCLENMPEEVGRLRKVGKLRKENK